MNPEFRRNLWLQLSWPRLVLTPILLGAVFALIWSGMGRGGVSVIAWWGFWVAAVLWGTRRAADSIGEEVAGGTWHGQRMSSLGAWSMTWGKLFGATVFAWYVALICLGVHLATWRVESAVSCSGADCLSLYERFWPAPAWMIAIGVFAQVVAMTAGLAALRRRPLSLRLPVTLAQGAGILLVALFLASHGALSPISDDPVWIALKGARSLQAGPVPWYGRAVDPLLLNHLVLALALGLSLLAAHRLMRVALQYRALPWGLVLGTLLVMALSAGYAGSPAAGDPPRLFWIAAGAVYLGLFTDRIDFPRLLRLNRAVRTAEVSTAARLAPSSAAALILALVAGILAIIIESGGTSGPFRLGGDGEVGSAYRIVAQLFNLLRDIAIVLWFHLAINTRRADLGALVTLGVLYLLLPFALDAAGFYSALARFGPVLPGAVTVGLAVVEAVVAWAFLASRWRLRARALAASS